MILNIPGPGGVGRIPGDLFREVVEAWRIQTGATRREIVVVLDCWPCSRWGEA